MINVGWRFACSILLVVSATCNLRATAATNDVPKQIHPFAPQGTLCLVGGGRIDDEFRKRLVAISPKVDDGRRVLAFIPTASQDVDGESKEKQTKIWTEAGFDEVLWVHTRSHAVANSKEFAAVFEKVSAVWLGGGSQSRLAEAYVETKTERAIQDVLERGGLVGGTSAGAAIASRVMIAHGKDSPEISTGMDLLPHAIVDQHFRQRHREKRLEIAVEQHPHRVGIGIDEGTCLVIRGRRLEVVGEGTATVCFASTKYHAATKRTLTPGDRDLDWTILVREQKERHQAPFPEVLSGRPLIKSGALMIVGGGGMSVDLWRRFIDLAGGPQAKIIVLNTAVPMPSEDAYEARVLRRLGVGSVKVLNQIAPSEIASRGYIEEFHDVTGIWFSGGRQWHFVDHYEGTEALQEMKKVLDRGGVIGGSSAGASIQGDLLIRGAPPRNTIMVQDGYRRGFAFLPGVGIDQHFSQRYRFADLAGVIQRFPNVLGIGIDESTALIVQKNKGQVAGKGSVFLYHYPDFSKRSSLSDREQPLEIPTGESFDFSAITSSKEKSEK